MVGAVRVLWWRTAYLVACAALGLAGRADEPGPAAHPVYLLQRQPEALRGGFGARPFSSDLRLSAHELLTGGRDSAHWHTGSAAGIPLLALVGHLSDDKPLVVAGREALLVAVTQPDWHDPSHADRTACICMAGAAADVAVAYDWLYPHMSELERSRAREGLQRLAFEPYAKLVESREFPMGEFAKNWCAALNAGFGTAAALLSGESEPAARLLPVAKEQVRGVLDAAGIDGGWNEGLGYWGYSMGAILQFVDVLQSMGMDDDGLAQHPYLRCAGDLPLYLYLPPDRVVPFGDSSSHLPRSCILYWLAAHNGDAHLQWLAERAPDPNDWRSFLWRDPDLPSARPDDLPPGKLFRGVDWAVMRSGWEDDATVLTLKSGTKGHHSHLDIDSVVLHTQGETLLIDPGRRGYRADHFAPDAAVSVEEGKGWLLIVQDGDGV